MLNVLPHASPTRRFSDLERQQASSKQSSSSSKRNGTPRGEPPRWRLWLRRTLRWGLGLAVVALAALGVAVGIAVQRMPSFEELKKPPAGQTIRSEEHTSELQSLMRSSYAVFCLKQ